MRTVNDFRIEQKPSWCPGCGDYAVLAALQKAATNLGLNPDNIVLVTGIGCSSKLSQHFNSYGFHGLHGRTLPVATGVKLTNQDLTVIAAGGDGDGYGIGLGHFMHTLRRNIDITYIVMDNHIYGLTTGQTSPVSPKGFKSKTSPEGSAEEPIRPLHSAIINGASFVAQAYAGDIVQMTEMFEQGIKHQGFSHINIFSPCVSFNKINTYEWFKEHIYNLDNNSMYNVNDKFAALKVLEDYQSIVTGVLYTEERPIYHEIMIGATTIPTTELALSIPDEDINNIKSIYRYQ